jgi:hypothetical protein
MFHPLLPLSSWKKKHGREGFFYDLEASLHPFFLGEMRRDVECVHVRKLTTHRCSEFMHLYKEIGING